MQFVTLVKFCKNVIHHCPNNNSEESSPCRINGNHIPAPPLYHTHRSELIGHIRSESEKGRFLDYLNDRPLSLNSWDDNEQEEDENIEEVKCYRRNEIHICIEIRRNVFLKHWKYDKPDHDTIEYEEGEDSRDVREDVGEHGEKD